MATDSSSGRTTPRPEFPKFTPQDLRRIKAHMAKMGKVAPISSVAEKRRLSAATTDESTPKT